MSSHTCSSTGARCWAGVWVKGAVLQTSNRTVQQPASPGKGGKVLNNLAGAASMRRYRTSQGFVRTGDATTPFGPNERANESTDPN